MRGLSALPLLAALNAPLAQADDLTPAINTCPTVLIDQLPVPTEIDSQTCRELTALGVTVEKVRPTKWAINGIHANLPCLGEAGLQAPTIDITDDPAKHPGSKILFQTIDATRKAWEIVVSVGSESHTIGVEGEIITTMDGQPLSIHCE